MLKTNFFKEKIFWKVRVFSQITCRIPLKSIAQLHSLSHVGYPWNLLHSFSLCHMSDTPEIYCTASVSVTCQIPLKSIAQLQSLSHVGYPWNLLHSFSLCHMSDTPEIYFCTALVSVTLLALLAVCKAMPGRASKQLLVLSASAAVVVWPTGFQETALASWE